MLNPHLTLIKNIKDGERTFRSLSESEFKGVYDASIANSDLTVLRMLINHHTGIYDYDERAPKWLDSEFEAPQWTLTLHKRPKMIRWDSVYLDDGRNLTDPKHTRLLNTFKYWISAIDNPLENGGRVGISNTIIGSRLNTIICLINAILLHSSELKLAEHRLLNIDDNFWFNNLTNIAIAGGIEGVYAFDVRIKKLLDVAANYISNEEVERFITDYPHLTNTLSSDDIRLNLNNRQKACAWLYKQGYYKENNNYKGNNRILVNLLFSGKCLCDDNLLVRTFPELYIKPEAIKTEFKAVENLDTSSGTLFSTISGYISALKLIYTNIDRNDAYTPHILGEGITAKAINDVKDVWLKTSGRTRTLPASFVFKLIEQCYGFVKKSQEDLLEMCFNALQEGNEKLTIGGTNKHRLAKHQPKYNEDLHAHLPNSERGHWFYCEAIKCVNSEWLKRGVKQVDKLAIKTDNRHSRIRNNESLFDLFDVLQGATQFLVGALMARRQGELAELKAYGNLVPNRDPFSIADEERLLKADGLQKSFKTQYSLKFKLKKSGTRGNNETIERPIPTSIAKFIWRLEQFNRKAENAKLNKGKLFLFNNLHSSTCTLSAVNSLSFNNHFDAMCDYFETDLVLMDNGEYRRNYVRQHQLRRFFAMTFFWSKGFKGMDTLRWMLGHTDMEHLFHYITESETGAVMNGVKAGVLMSGVIDRRSDHAEINNLDKLRKLLAKNLMGDETKDIEIMSPSEALHYYDDVDYNTVPHINQIKREQEIETEILNLLDDHTISLEPHFFTVESKDGAQLNTFSLVLQIKEIY